MPALGIRPPSFICVKAASRISPPTRSKRMSAERLTLTGRRGRLDRVQHAMAGDRVVKGRAEMRSLAIVAGEVRVRLGDVPGRARVLGRGPPLLLCPGQNPSRERAPLPPPMA